MAAIPPRKAEQVAARDRPSLYPKPFSLRVNGRQKRVLGDVFGLQNFGVNHTTLAPGAISALHHQHARQDELIYILEGKPTLYLDDQSYELEPGMVAGFPAGGAAHHLENRTDQAVIYLEIGDRTKGDSVVYPDDDLYAESGDQGWVFQHKDGTPYKETED